MSVRAGMPELKLLVQSFASGGVKTEQELRDAINQYVQMINADVSDEEIASLFDEMRNRHGVRMEFGAALIAPDFEDWFDAARRRSTDWFYWERYRDYLADSGFPGPVLEAMNEKTNMVIKLCGDPKADAPFDRRGMVMGDVQAGKTGNYTALVSKAADVGYRVIIIIAGIHENLRSQTQKRVDEGLIGRNSDISPTEVVADGGRVGVGWSDFSRLPRALTGRKADFRKGQASIGWRLDSDKEEPFVFVIKKNASILKHILGWLKSLNLHKGSDLIDLPMILIDDEADNASINVAKGAGAVSKINGQIRDLLNLFKKSSYVAFTATPFANIFIDPDVEHEEAGKDLFPEHFLISLDRPGNYYGAEKVFLNPELEEDRPTRDIEDNEPHLPLKMPKGHQVLDLPGSLTTAIRAFIVSGAVRDLRGQRDKHHSMLINVSHLTAVQTQVANLIRHHMNDVVKPALKMHCALPPDKAERNDEIAACRDVFETEYADGGENWSDVLPLLYRVAERATVYEVNSKSGEKLVYPDVIDAENDQVTAIAVGGYSLSRGLTLEGLTISYFLRNSKAYDTLLQMARWFGYRPGYEDLCRVWIKEEAREWYAHIAAASEELRRDLRYMAGSEATPRDFGLRVRTHEKALEITARNKAGSGHEVIVEVGLARSRIETTVIHDNEPGNEAQLNRDAALELYKKLSVRAPTMHGASEIWHSVPAELVKDYLGRFMNHKDAERTQTEPVIRYVEDRQDENLSHWDVVFVGSTDKSAAASEYLPIDLPLQERTFALRENGKVVATSRRFSSRGVCRLGMDDQSIDRVKANAGGAKNIDDTAYLAERPRPILAIHFLKLIDRETGKLIDEPPVSAWTIGFPSSARKNQTVSYRVNTVWWRQNMTDIDEEVAEALDREE
ncbi:Z1 domain-containing protein [Sulfitobacter delicatus]|uniref:Z1 domain-containing protein n=1 Tax=Sulfitobacter delicatus TaxID=218672 RepID=A0A1G7U6R7_9RHOB|nr:Z1 domain-containing protein [Sulfitobacter delicatus]SDG43143.1 Z1 domain-containing protein [Sulfitobacter delicatus]